MSDKQDSLTDLETGPWGPPSAIAFIFLAWAILIPSAFSTRVLNTDGDLATHMYLGRLVLEHGITFTSDWAHTKPGGTFVAFEWLSEVVFVRLFDFGGLAAILVAATLAIATSLTLIASVLRARLSPLYLLPAAFLIALLTGNHWIARPHLNSFLGLSLLLFLTTRPFSFQTLPIIGVFFMLWANFHPGFTYGLIMLGAFLAGDALDRGRQGFPWLHLSAFTVAFVATFLNPLGWGLHLHILEVLADSRAYELIEEFRATSPLTLAGAIFYGTLILCVAIVIIAGRRPNFTTLLVFVTAAFFAILSERNVSLFALYALPLFLWHYAPDIQARIPKRLTATNQNMLRDDRRGKTLIWIGAAVLALLTLAATSGRVGPIQVLPNAFSDKVFPVEAVTKARAADFENTQFFHSYIWGGYLLHAWPEQKIYIDGQSNYFGSALLEEYVIVNTAAPGWEDILATRNIDAILVRVDSGIATATRTHPDWAIWHEDETAILLRRR